MKLTQLELKDLAIAELISEVRSLKKELELKSGIKVLLKLKEDIDKHLTLVT